MEKTPSRSPSPLSSPKGSPGRGPPGAGEMVDLMLKTLYEKYPAVTNDYEAARKHLRGALAGALKAAYGESFKLTLYCYPMSAIDNKRQFVFVGAYNDNYSIPWNMAYTYGLLMVKVEQRSYSPVTYVWAPARLFKSPALLMHHSEAAVNELFGTIEQPMFGKTYTVPDFKNGENVKTMYQKLIEERCMVTKKRGR